MVILSCLAKKNQIWIRGKKNQFITESCDFKPVTLKFKFWFFFVGQLIREYNLTQWKDLLLFRLICFCWVEWKIEIFYVFSNISISVHAYQLIQDVLRSTYFLYLVSSYPLNKQYWPFILGSNLSHFLTYDEMVFCYQNCSDLLWEKIVLVIEKSFEIQDHNNLW